MKKTKGMWTSIVVVIVLAVLALWWIVARMPLFSSTDVAQQKAQQAAQQNATTTQKTTATGKAPITRVSRSTQNVTSIVAGLSTASQFNALFRSTGVASSISSTGHYTIFVPTNGAFGQLPGGTISSMTTAQKKRLVQYHVVTDRAIDVDAEVQGSIQALSGDYLNFNYGENKIPLVNSAIVIAEYTGKNGTVYLIDNVLLPPKKQGI